MSTDSLKPETPARRSAPQLQWNLAACEVLIGLHESHVKHVERTGDELSKRILIELTLRFADDRWDEESRVLLAARGLRVPTSIEEVEAAEEAMKGEESRPLPEELKDPYAIMRKHPEIFGEK